ncbi:hypothetical protein SAMN04487926_11866 [Paraburkholderia steynii]|uniref:Uncharacterized protein n=1 Tax=Paraburkholderia steynii TaxID=1245441 RepID=A0A7Z7BB10_9BURK|nr:hypothetical protein SAMN04487926_11866 [Paraburkholderia steynii]
MAVVMRAGLLSYRILIPRRRFRLLIRCRYGSNRTAYVWFRQWQKMWPLFEQHFGRYTFGRTVHTDVGDVAQPQPDALVAEAALRRQPCLFELTNGTQKL